MNESFERITREKNEPYKDSYVTKNVLDIKCEVTKNQNIASVISLSSATFLPLITQRNSNMLVCETGQNWHAGK